MRPIWKWPKKVTKQRLYIAFANPHFGSKIKNAKKKCWQLFYNTLQLFYAKNGSKKQLLFEKFYHFENGKKSQPSKGYNLSKILTLGQKLKMQTNMLKTFLQHIAVVRCKKQLKRRTNIRKMIPFGKFQKRSQSKGYSLCKILILRQKLKMQKNMLNTFLRHIAVVLCKKRFEKKELILKKWDHFENSRKRPPSKGYSFKNPHFGSKIKNANKHP